MFKKSNKNVISKSNFSWNLKNNILLDSSLTLNETSAKFFNISFLKL
jgi:hypothetical protein